MIVGVADTHAALWYMFADARLSDTAKNFIKNAAAARQNIAISSISLAEVVYLCEKGRFPISAYDDLIKALADPDHVFTETAVNSAVVEAMRSVSRAEIPEMPDRIVAATSKYLDVPVVSRDRRIRAANLRTIW